MQISKAGVNLIKSFEGFVGHPYKDSVGVWTIGYGHTEGVNSHSPHLTKRQASELLLHDVNHAYSPAVEGQLFAYRIRRFLNQNQFDALVSFAFNLGPGILSPTHTIGQKLKAVGGKQSKSQRDHHLTQVADSMLLYDYGGGHKIAGLTRRRKEERALFLKPVKKGK